MSRQRALFTSSSPLVIEVGSRYSAWVFGPGIVRATDRVGCKRQWCGEQHTWMVPTRRVPDLVADCDSRGRRVVVRQVTR